MFWLKKLIRDERFLFGALAINVVTWVIASRYLLKKWRDEAEIKPQQPKTQYITQETEDALKLSTLETLLGHYNYAIRETAAKIVCDRAVNDKETVDMLLWGITRPDYDERIKNLRALAIITDQQSLERLHCFKAYSALVRSLELSLDPEQEVLNDPNWDDYPLRDMTEKLCLMFISQLINCYDCEKLVKAKFVEKWLAKQNWGSTPEERLKNFSQYNEVRNNRITDIVAVLRTSRSGRAALEKAGLLEPVLSPIDSEVGDNEAYRLSVVMSGNFTLNNLQEHANAVMRSLEAAARTAEEQRRHRHREAMVLNDGSRPVNSDDIIQPEPRSPS